MKKILVLMLVLGITSMASAGLTLAGPTTVGLGGTVTLQVVHDGSAAVVDGLDYGNVYVTPTSAVTAIAWTSNMSQGGMSAITDYLATYGYFYVIGANTPTENKLLAGTWVNFDISAGALPGGSVIAITLLGVPHDVTVIPEPMTIGLLGLGGLFLRRRK